MADPRRIDQSITAQQGSQIRDILQIGTVEQLSIRVLNGLDRLPTRYDGNIRSFLEYYLGSSDQPVAFGGRQAALDQLDAWFNDSHSVRYAMLLARAGMGKSAILARWVTRLSTVTSAVATHIVFVPIRAVP